MEEAAKGDAGAEEASNVSIDGGGSCGSIPRRQQEMHMESIMEDGTAHESYNSRSCFRLIC